MKAIDLATQRLDAPVKKQIFALFSKARTFIDLTSQRYRNNLVRAPMFVHVRNDRATDKRAPPTRAHVTRLDKISAQKTNLSRLLSRSKRT